MNRKKVSVPLTLFYNSTYEDLFGTGLCRSFDFVPNHSSLKHVGLQGRYGVDAEVNGGDLKAMRRFRELLKETDRMLLTTPSGQDAVMGPWHHVYAEKRLSLLLAGYQVGEKLYWVKHKDNRWHPCEKAQAQAFLPTSHPESASMCAYASLLRAQREAIAAIIF